MPDSSNDDLFGNAVGGRAARVIETGIALVHEGELVLPQAGAEAAAELVEHDDRVIINYYFPVEIEVRGGGETVDPREAVELALSAFAAGLQNLV